MKDLLKKDFVTFSSVSIQKGERIQGGKGGNSSGGCSGSEAVNTLNDGSSQSSYDWTSGDGTEYHDSCPD